jgi:hypothetical protein
VANGKKRRVIFDSDTEDVGHTSKKRRVQPKTIKKASRNDNEEEEAMNVEASDDEVLLPAVSYLNVQRIPLNALLQPKVVGAFTRKAVKTPASNNNSKTEKTTRKAAKMPVSNNNSKTEKTTRKAAKMPASNDNSDDEFLPPVVSDLNMQRISLNDSLHPKTTSAVSAPKKTTRKTAKTVRSDETSGTLQETSTRPNTRASSTRKTINYNEQVENSGLVAAPKFARKAGCTVLTVPS